MKSVTILIILLFVSNAYSQVSFDKDLENLKKRKNEEVQKATLEVNRKYKQGLENLHRSAIRNGDVATAVKIQQEIAALPAKLLINKDHPTNAKELATFLNGTTWSIRTGSPTGKENYKQTYSKTGLVKISDGRETTIAFKSMNTFSLWGSDIATLNINFNQFTVRDSKGGSYYGVLVVE